MGVVIMAGVLLALKPAGGAAPMPPVFTFVAVGMAGAAVLLAYFIPAAMEPTWRRSMAAGKWPSSGPHPEPDSDEAWWVQYPTRLILIAALLEGAAFFELIAYFLDGQPLYLGLAGGLLVLLLLQFPTRTGVESWVATQREMVARMKSKRRNVNEQRKTARPPGLPPTAAPPVPDTQPRSRFLTA